MAVFSKSRSGTFVYAPDIAVYLHTGESDKAGVPGDEPVMEISKDIVNFTLQRLVNGISSFEMTLANKRDKYTRRIPRMARIVVFLKRVGWVQVFSGYVTSAPFEQLVPDNVTIRADCTVKRIHHTWWDEMSIEAMALFPSMTRVQDVTQKDGGAGLSMLRLLTAVGNWNPNFIHIQKLPEAFIEAMTKAANKMAGTVDLTIAAAINALLDGDGYAPGEGAGDDSAVPSEGTGNLSVGSGVQRGNQKIYDTVAEVVATLPYNYQIISWNRPGAVVAGTGNPSRHATGDALDIAPEGASVGGPSPCGGSRLDDESMRQNDALAKALEEAGFGVVLWKTCTGGNHYNHVHVDSPGGGSGGTTSSVPEQSGMDWSEWNIYEKQLAIIGGGYIEAQALTGERAFINDVQLIESITTLCMASMRNYQSAPNGDFVAWFPDRFGVWGKTPMVRIRDIEIINFTLQVSDDPLTTHVAARGNLLPNITTQTSVGSVGFDPNWIMSAGIVSVENERVFKLLLGLDQDLDYHYLGDWILRRFGMRPHVAPPLSAVRDHKWEFFFALNTFMEKWSEQFASSLQTTFLPEVYPGMRVELVDHGLALYVEQVTHQGNRDQGFTTTMTVTSPMQRVKGEWRLMHMERKPEAIPESEDRGEAEEPSWDQPLPQ